MRLLPREEKFYHLFLKQVEIISEASRLLMEGVRGGKARLASAATEINVLEHRGDEVIHEIFTRLNQTFITPIDREDIARLVHVLDDVIDAVDAAANRLVLYEVEQPTPEMQKATDIIEEQVKHIQASLTALRRRRQIAKDVPPHLVEIHRLENAADRLLNTSVAGLFRTHDPVQILKYKEVYELLEAATDRCEDVADVLSDVVRKHS